MKKLKVILSSLAFASAITLTFAFSSTSAIAIQPQAFGQFSQGCAIGTLVENPGLCSTSNLGVPCTVTLNFETANAYTTRTNGICVNQLRLPL